MAVKVAINGFGRIGRLAFRQMFDAEGYEVVAINDLTSPKMLAYLLKYDSSQGKYEYADTVEAGEDSITVKGKTIKIYAEKDAKNIPWAKHDVDVVLECTGFYTSKERLPHISKLVLRKSLSPLRQARTSRRSCSTRTISPSRLARRSSPLLPARRTASLRWQRPSMTSLRSRAASCRRSTLSRAIR